MDKESKDKVEDEIHRSEWTTSAHAIIPNNANNNNNNNIASWDIMDVSVDALNRVASHTNQLRQDW